VQQISPQQGPQLEPFVENETMNKRVPKNRFPNPLATNDVSGHNLGTFFEKVPDFEKVPKWEPFHLAFKQSVPVHWVLFKRVPKHKGFSIEQKDHKHPVVPVAASSRATTCCVQIETHTFA